MLRKDMHEENRLGWNLATEAHNSHKADQAGFFRNGGSTLYPEEIALLGDLSGKSLVHLQCNAGQDSLSLVRLGATVTGVDISDTAVEFARRLSDESGLPATFVRSDVYDWLDEAGRSGEQYDIAFSSYGALIWLSDIRLWARGVASVIRSGGKLVVMEFHPFAMIFSDDWRPAYNYFDGTVGTHFETGVGDYVAMSGEVLAPSGYLEGVQNFVNPHRSHEFNWSIGEILTAVAEAGLKLTIFHEYPYMNGAKLFEGMQGDADGRFYPPETMPSIPLMYGLVAEKV